MINPGMFGYHTSAGRYTQDTSPPLSSHTTRRDATILEERLERLSLVCMAMWSLLQDKTNLTEEDLMERVKTIDLMDGVEDGKAQRTVQKCHACNRVMSPRHRKCIYCGADRLTKSAFDAI